MLQRRADGDDVTGLAMCAVCGGGLRCGDEASGFTDVCVDCAAAMESAHPRPPRAGISPLSLALNLVMAALWGLLAWAWWVQL